MSQEVIRYASNLSCLIPLTLYVWRINSTEKRIHVISMVMLISGLADLITFFPIDGINIALIFNLQDIIQFALLAAFYYIIESDRKIVRWGISIYITALIAVTMWSQSIFVYQSLMWTTSGIIILAFASAYLIHLYRSGSQNRDITASTLWINTGLLFYFTLSLFLFVMGDYILNELPERTRDVYWSVHNVNNIVKNLFIAIGIAYSKKHI